MSVAQVCISSLCWTSDDDHIQCFDTVCLFNIFICQHMRTNCTVQSTGLSCRWMYCTAVVSAVIGRQQAHCVCVNISDEPMVHG